MPVAIEPTGPLLRLSPPETPRERAAWAWADLTTGKSVAAIGAWQSDIARFGRATWGDAHGIRTIARVIEALDRDRAAFRELARAHIDAERTRGAAEATLARRWATFVALARAISGLRPRAPKLELGPRPVARERVDPRQIVASLLLAHMYRDACMVGLVAETGLRRAQIAALRVGELAPRGGSAALRRAIAEHTRGKPARAWAFPGRALGDHCATHTVDRVCERHGTTFAALRRGKDRTA